MRTLELTVPADAAKKKVETWLARAAPGFDDARALRLLRDGKVRIGGKAARPGRKLWGGETVVVTLPAPASPPWIDRDGPAVRVLRSDAHVVVVAKPAGIVSDHESGRPSVQGLLASQLDGWDVGGLAGPGVVHRLDRDTSGVLAFARSDAGLGGLLRAFDEGLVEKTYLAVVAGSPPDTGRFDTPYARDPDNPRRYTTRLPSPRRARLGFRTIERFREHALVEVALETGRTHQVRAQFADAGHPVLGDALYGPTPSRNNPLGRHALHALRLAFPHPVGGPPVVVEAPLPDNFTTLLETLRRPETT